MRLLKFILPLLVVAVGVGLFQYFRANKVEPAPIESRIRPPVVAVTVVESRTLSPQLTVFGRIEAPNNSVLSAGISADVVAVSALEGDAVAADEVLIRLDDADVALEILQRKASIVEIEAQIESDRRAYAADREALEREQALLALTRKSVERARTLARSAAGTEATLDNALLQEEQQLLAITQRRRSIDDFSSRQKLWRARLENAEAALARARRDLSRTVVKAPYSGRVTEVMVAPGDRATPGTPLLRLYESGRLEVRAQVPSRYVPGLRDALDRDLEVRAVLRDNGHEIGLVLHRLAAMVEQGQGGVDVFFRAQSEALPALGSTVELSLQLPPLDNVVALPPDALYGDNRAYRINGDVLESVMVTRVGQFVDSEGRQLLLMDGRAFNDGDRVLVSRLPQAIDGLAVETEAPDG